MQKKGLDDLSFYLKVDQGASHTQWNNTKQKLNKIF